MALADLKTAATDFTTAAADFKTTATEKIGGKVHSAKRMLRKRANDLEDLRDATSLRIRRAPLQTMAIAVGSSLVLGWAIGYMRGRVRSGRMHENDWQTRML